MGGACSTVDASQTPRRNASTSSMDLSSTSSTITRAPPKWSSEAPLTEGQLRSKRDEFWDTAPKYEGREEVWQALRAAAEESDPEMAQAIIVSSNIKLPNGNLTLAWDELGNKYEIPPFCLSRPTNMLDERPAAADAELLAGPTCADDTVPTVDIKIRFSTAEEMLLPKTAETCTMSSIKARISEKHNISGDRLRFFYSGRQLTDTQTVLEAGIQTGWVLQVMIKPED